MHLFKPKALPDFDAKIEGDFLLERKKLFSEMDKEYQEKFFKKSINKEKKLAIKGIKKDQLQI
jgi:hypothetical protein